MKCSVLIIAHNESAHIEECLRSVFSQTLRPDEVLLVAHNCTDDTVERARSFPSLRIEELRTAESGPVFARIRGFELASHEIVACLDGDAVADAEWLREIMGPFSQPDVVGIGGTIRFFDGWFENISAFLVFSLWKHLPGYHFYFWGANFACRKSAYVRSGGLSPLITVGAELWLAYLADDCYLSLSLERCGKVLFVPQAVVRVYAKKSSVFWKLRRSARQSEDCNKLFSYFWIR